LMNRRSFACASLILPVTSQGGTIPQHYDYSYQFYDEGSDRIQIESHYFRGSLQLDNETTFRFQWLRDGISGASPTGALPGSTQPFLANLEDVRYGVLGAISRKFGDHLVELEVSRSSESDYLSYGYALKDVWEINEKNTAITFGINYLDDKIKVPILGTRYKDSVDLFLGLNQTLDKNTVVFASYTLGYSDGYLNDPYKAVQRTDIVSVPDGAGGTIDFPVDNLYRENRPDSRLRQVIQVGGRHYFDPVKGALNAVYRFGHDDFGVNSHTFQLEWRQSIGTRLEVTPFFRYYHQSEADFFMRTIDGLPIDTPANDPDGSGLNYSSDYRLSSFDAISGGVRLRYKINDTFSATAAYERYEMTGSGGAGRTAPEQAYIDANMWTFGISAEF
ncbi:MAG TPA: DUF3570 domain-containing protein, partial [Verrucomicrobiales bacterium]|nr:DUF3570 domain-containing protein [Verrucomicrobiales bacterium]